MFWSKQTDPICRMKVSKDSEHKSELKNIKGFTRGQKGSLDCDQCNSIATKYPSLVDVSENKFLDTLIRIKYCIFEGFKLNLAKFNPTTSRYEINAGSIKTPKLFNEKELSVYKEYGIESKHVPKYILYDELNIKYNRKTKI